VKRRSAILIAAVVFVIIGLAAGIKFVSANAPKGAVPEDLPRNQTLYIGGFWWGTPTNFNPLSSDPAWPDGANLLLSYETLFAYNQLTNGLDPLLASSYVLAPDSSSITVTLQDGTMWQDGELLTADDVVYTYELAQSQPNISYREVYSYITEIQSTGDRTLLITLNDAQLNPGVVMYYLTQIKILPMHIWQPREAGGPLVDYIDTNPIGSGPYKLNNFSPDSIILFRNDNYWGQAVFGLPTPRYVVHPIYASNDDLIQAFQNGDVDMDMQFIRQIWELGDKIGTWYDQPPYFLPGSIPILIINTTKPGLDNPLVRRALAYSIDYATIASTAMSQYSEVVSSSLILPAGGESPLFNPEQVALYGWTYDPAMTYDILVNQLGATMGGDGVYVLPGGTRLGPWSARTVTGWTDWEDAITIVVSNTRTAGFDLYTDFPGFMEVWSKLQVGDFDLCLFYIHGSGTASPWQRFRDMLDDRGVPPIGQPAYWNYGRFSDPAVPALLDQAGAATDPISVKDVYDQLDRIFMDNAVGIPLMYRPGDFYEFNTTYWTNFPTDANPSAPPMFNGAGVEVLYRISPWNIVFLPVVTR
jgi:peptide/nickel transport system substrate-binding protein